MILLEGRDRGTPAWKTSGIRTNRYLLLLLFFWQANSGSISIYLKCRPQVAGKKTIWQPSCHKIWVSNHSYKEFCKSVFLVQEKLWKLLTESQPQQKYTHIYALKLIRTKQMFRIGKGDIIVKVSQKRPAGKKEAPESSITQQFVHLARISS